MFDICYSSSHKKKKLKKNPKILLFPGPIRELRSQGKLPSLHLEIDKQRSTEVTYLPEAGVRGAINF